MEQDHSEYSGGPAELQGTSPHIERISTTYEPSNDPVNREESSPNPSLQTALKYAEKGLSVLPLAPGEKVPFAGTNGPHDATTDPEIIRGWFRDHPDANLGIATGEKSGIFVLDIDGEAGEQSLQKMIDRLAGEPPDFTTPQNQTPGGRHILFNLPGFRVSNKGGMRKGIDLRGEGGYIVAPPSIHPSGEPYQWNPYLSIHDLDPIDAPDWLLDEIRPSSDREEPSTQERIDPSKFDRNEDRTHPAVVATRRAGKPLEELEPGERNNGIFYSKMTWCNCDQDPEEFDAWFWDSVFPELNKGKGHDGEKFDRDEASQTLLNAEKSEYRVDLPEELKDYFLADTKPSYTKGPDQWTTVELCRILLAFFDRYGTLTLDSRDVEDGGVTEGLLRSVQGWIGRHWKDRDSVPRSSLRKALDHLIAGGHIKQNQETHRERDEKGRITDRYTTGTFEKTSPSDGVKSDLNPTDIPCCINGSLGERSIGGGQGNQEYLRESSTSDPPFSVIEVSKRGRSRSKMVEALKEKYPEDFDV